MIHVFHNFSSFTIRIMLYSNNIHVYDLYLLVIYTGSKNSFENNCTTIIHNLYTISDYLQTF